MARRKVTMLEAFQRSARESAERALTERRRVIAEREKEIRRAETARTAQEFSSRLSQRAGDSVGSLLAGIRGAPVARLEADVAPASRVEPSDDQPDADAPDIRSVPPMVDTKMAPTQVAPKRNGPALPAFDRAVHAELPDVSSTLAGAAQSVSSPASVASGADVEVEISEEPPFAEASSEEVEEAIAALETEVFELPMSSKTFALLGLAAALAVFMIGYSFGNRGESAGSRQSGPGVARAGMTLSSSNDLAPNDRAPSTGEALDGSTLSGTLSGDRSSPDGARQVLNGGAHDAPNPSAADSDSRADQDEQRVVGTALTPEDRIFRSAKMKFTIMAITYSATEAHARLARETYDYLYDQGFPVIQPIEKDSRLFIFVGASASMGDLEALKRQLQNLESGQNRDARPFRTSFVVNIDPYR